MAKKDGAQTSTKRKRTKLVDAKEVERLRSIGFQVGNPWRWKKGHVVNPGGRPKLLSDAYREMLKHEDKNGMTNAAKIAMNAGMMAVEMNDLGAMKEVRQATEGDLIRTFKDMTDDDLNNLIQERERRIRADAGGEDPADESSG